MEDTNLEKYFFLLLFVVGAGLLLYIFSPYLSVLLVAGGFAIVFRPLHERILTYFPDWPGIASLLTILVIFFVIFTPLTFLGIQVFTEARELYGRLAAQNFEFSNAYFDSLMKQIHDIVPSFEINVGEYVRQFLNWTIESSGVIISGFAQAALKLFIGFFALFYFLKDGRLLKSAIASRSLLSPHYAREILDKLETTVDSVMKGSLFIAVIQGVLAGVGFVLFGVPQPALWGSLSVVAALLPVVGSAIVTMPAALYLFLVHGALFQAVGLALWGTILVGSADNLLRPYLMKREVSLHPFLILLSVVGGLHFFSAIGFLVGPLILSFVMSLLDMYPHFVSGGAADHHA